MTCMGGCGHSGVSLRVPDIESESSRLSSSCGKIVQETGGVSAVIWMLSVCRRIRGHITGATDEGRLVWAGRQRGAKARCFR